MTPDEVDALKLPDLKAKCKALGLSAVGVKAELVARVKEALAAAEVIEEEEVVEEEVVKEAEPAGAGSAAAEPAAAQPAARVSADGKHKLISFDEALLSKDKDTVKLEVTHVDASAEPAAEAGTAPALTDAERLAKRAERFQDPAVAKMKERAQRFGLSHPEIDKEKAIQRAVKFGTLHPALEEEKKKKRAERFGIVDEDTKKKQRQEKFKPLASTAAATTAPAAAPAAGGKAPLTFTVASADGDDFQAKKSARALRFGA